MARVQEVKVPDIGDFKDVEIVEVIVKPGDKVQPEDPLITLESDKASMEVPAPFAGKVKEVKVKVGDRVSEGDLILLMEAGEVTSPVQPPSPEGVQESDAHPIAPPSPRRRHRPPPRQPRLMARPRARRAALPACMPARASGALARELGVASARSRAAARRAASPRTTSRPSSRVLRPSRGARGRRRHPRDSAVDFAKFGAT